MDNLWLFTSN